MKSILVYGDSLVWGRNTSQKDRHSFDDRWPNVIASSLKGGGTKAGQVHSMPF